MPFIVVTHGNTNMYLLFTQIFISCIHSFVDILKNDRQLRVTKLNLILLRYNWRLVVN